MSVDGLYFSLCNSALFVVRPRVKGQYLVSGKILLRVMAEVQEGKSNCTEIFQNFVCTISADIPLAKTSQMAKAFGDREIHSAHHEAKIRHVTKNSIG